METKQEYRCNICPRNCNAVRAETYGEGICGMGTTPTVSKAMRHYWEEPCISGDQGSGAIFFTGCALGCVYCQNSEISMKKHGKSVTAQRLQEIYFELIEKGVHNISLVTPTHFADSILLSLENGLPVPIVYNSGGYDSVDTLKRFDGKIQIYLPDMKYGIRQPAQRYSSASDYPDIAKLAISEMFRQTGSYVLNSNGLLKSGVIIRHLVLPGNLTNTFRVIDWVAETFSPGDILFSLMSQYTPHGCTVSYPELKGRLTQREYDTAKQYLDDSDIEDGFYQELSSASEEYIPDFDLDGV